MTSGRIVYSFLFRPGAMSMMKVLAYWTVPPVKRKGVFCLLGQTLDSC